MNYGPSQGNHADADTYRRAADAFRRKDLGAVAETIHEDITWHFPGSSWVSREIQGRDALLAYLKEVMTRTKGTFVLEDLSISGTGHHVVAIQRFSATREGSTEKFDALSVMRFEGGRQIERWFYILDHEAFDAFFAGFK